MNELYLNIDEEKMNQVIRNLLSNAIKFTPKRGIVIVRVTLEQPDIPIPIETTTPICSSITILLSSLFNKLSTWYKTPPLPLVNNSTSTSTDSHKSIGMIKISIIDSGAGVDKEDQMKLFQEYVQINPGELQKGQGSGLGLSISKSIIAMHGGHIGMSSQGKGHGSTFFIQLPIYRHSSLSTSNQIASNIQLSSTTGRSFSYMYDSHSSSSPSMISEYIPAIPRYQRQGSHMRNIESKVIPIASNTTNDNECTEVEVMHCDNKHIETPSQSNENCNCVGDMKAKCYHILIVDDSNANRKMLGKLLQRDGHTIIEANDGSEAVNIMRMLLLKPSDSCDIENTIVPTMIDIILMDNFMIEMNGPEATAAIRAMGFRGPILGITGMLGDDIEKLLQSGVNIVLQKPIDMKSIYKALQALKFS